MIKEVIAKLAERRDLDKQESYAAMSDIMSGEAEDALISAFLVGLRSKGETVEEIAGCAQAMREKAIKIQTRHKNVIDTCGTGGDGSGTFNISTTAAIIASAAGVPVAKHGNRAVSSACGSADVLKALGINIEIPAETVSKVLDEIGITFLFAPLMHGAMKYAANVRKQLGIRTVFNILGPLTNPAGARRQIIGVFNPSLTEKMAAVLKELGSEHCLVVHGDGGFDEFSTLGESKVSELKLGSIRTYGFQARNLGIKEARKQDLQGGDATTNAEIIRSILSGKDGAPKDIALLNAAAAIVVGGKAGTMEEGISIARQTVDSGAGKSKLMAWTQATNSWN